MIQLYCDYCNKIIRNVAYVLSARDARNVNETALCADIHLHWKCIRLYGRVVAESAEKGK